MEKWGVCEHCGVSVYTWLEKDGKIICPYCNKEQSQRVGGLDKQKEAEKTLKKLDEHLGIIRVNAKFMLIPRKDGTLIVGGIFGKLLSSDEEEMWVAELTIRPAHKFTQHKEEGWKYLTIDQKLASGWGNKDNWEKEVIV